MDKRSPSKCKFPDFRLLAWKYLMSFSNPYVSFLLNFALPFSVMTHNSSKISWLKHYMQKELINVQFFRLLSALMSVQPIPHPIFKITRSGLVSWKITPLYFLAQTSYNLDKKSPSKWHFPVFEWFGQKFNKFLMAFETTVNFSLNLASLFIFMRDNSSVLF